LLTVQQSAIYKVSMHGTIRNEETYVLTVLDKSEFLLKLLIELE